MGMKLKSGADLCGFQLTNFCVQGEASAPSDAALGRKYFHTNATDDVATGISLLNRERIYLGEGAWRATAYLDDIAGIQTKLDMILGDVDLDGVIENMNEVIKFLEDNKDTENLMTLLNGKLSTSGGTISISSYGGFAIRNTADALSVIRYRGNVNDTNTILGYLGFNGVDSPIYMSTSGNAYTLIHSGNIGSYKAGGLAHSNGTVGAVVNSSGNVTIGGSDLAGTAAKLYVQNGDLWVNNTNGESRLRFGNFTYVGNSDGYSYIWNADNKPIALGTNATERMRITGNGNVLIGTTDDSGYKLDVYGGDIRCHISEALPRNIIVSNRNAAFGIRVAAAGNRGLYDATADTWMLYTNGTNTFIPNEVGGVIIGDRSELKSGAKLQVKGDLYVDGNIIATKEVSAGGAAAEEEGTSGSGSAEGVSEVFTPTSTSMAFDHNLGEDVIVQVYEKSGNVWNMVMVDVEITSATRVTLRFGKTETTQHKVVIMGV